LPFENVFRSRQEILNDAYITIVEIVSIENPAAQIPRMTSSYFALKTNGNADNPDESST